MAIGLASWWVFASFFQKAPASNEYSCIAILKQINGALEDWALEHKKNPGDPVTITDISGGPTAAIRKLINVNSKKESLQFFKQLKLALEPVVKDPLEEKFLVYFDIMSWLESKIENKKFADVVKSKLKPLTV